MENKSKVTIHIDGDTYDIEVGKKETILDAGLENDIDMPYSCQSGVCTSCQGKLISGNVKMNVSDALSDEEIAKGYILCCQSIPLTDSLVIEIE
jgi:ring-1,2-phenylacetyl-CoA epoxidase subunit PaaE